MQPIATDFPAVFVCKDSPPIDVGDPTEAADRLRRVAPNGPFVDLLFSPSSSIGTGRARREAAEGIHEALVAFLATMSAAGVVFPPRGDGTVLCTAIGVAKGGGDPRFLGGVVANAVGESTGGGVPSVEARTADWIDAGPRGAGRMGGLFGAAASALSRELEGYLSTKTGQDSPMGRAAEVVAAMRKDTGTGKVDAVLDAFLTKTTAGKDIQTLWQAKSVLERRMREIGMGRTPSNGDTNSPDSASGEDEWIVFPEHGTPHTVPDEAAARRALGTGVLSVVVRAPQPGAAVAIQSMMAAALADVRDSGAVPHTAFAIHQTPQGTSVRAIVALEHKPARGAEAIARALETRTRIPLSIACVSLGVAQAADGADTPIPTVAAATLPDGALVCFAPGRPPVQVACVEDAIDACAGAQVRLARGRADMPSAGGRDGLAVFEIHAPGATGAIPENTVVNLARIDGGARVAAVSTRWRNGRALMLLGSSIWDRPDGPGLSHWPGTSRQAQEVGGRLAALLTDQPHPSGVRFLGVLPL